MKLYHPITCLLCIAALILQVLALCGNMPGLHRVYYVKVDAIVQNGLLDTIRHTLLDIPDYLTMAAFVVCQGSYSSWQSKSCSPPSLGYRYEANGLLGLLEDAIPEKLHNALSSAQAGVLIPSACLAFLAVVILCLLNCIQRKARVLRWLAAVVVTASLAFAVASLAVQIVAYYAVRNALGQVSQRIPGTVQLQASLGPSVWVSLAAIVCLLLALVLWILSVCCCRKSSQEQPQDEAMEMDRM